MTTHVLGERRTNPLTENRLKLHALGYDIIPLKIDKRPITGWQTMSYGPEKIRRSGLPATGLRCLGHDTFFIDIDVTIEPVRDQILAAYAAEWPEFMRDCVRRHSGAVTLMLIGRCMTAKKSPHTLRFYNGPDDKKGNRVEVFTRNCAGQVVVQGAHSPGRTYGYIGRPLWEVPPEELPWFPDEDIFKTLDIAEAIMKATPGLEPRGLLLQAHKDYDLLPEWVFTLWTDDQVTLKELERDFEVYRMWADRTGSRGVRGYGTLWERASTTPDRVIVTLGAEGLCLYDTKTQIKHRWKHREPPKEHAELAAAMRELVQRAWA